ncbi:hypothetical protein [Roseibium alexandrii]|uniref:Uncharacterized protein n=1 Tax=Roseibium alexandrii (strain DSM 17067 / NCIMB 14079 / DFL-11) TaxID=244592 RepID=A0A5E8UWH2_ROSAD|nr:hypothetical protein [Roseibium alexandrii]RMX61768.1 hypothetical protein SADFL11_00009860 [Roseibium alexandrii DFL-11]
MTKIPISLSTLGDLKAAGYGVVGNCTAANCGRGRRLDLQALFDQFGADFVVVNENRIAAALRCDQCGHRGGVLTLHPPA